MYASIGHAGTYTITKVYRGDYKLTRLSGTDSTGATVGTVNGNGVKVSFTSAEQVHCTFINTRTNNPKPLSERELTVLPNIGRTVFLHSTSQKMKVLPSENPGKQPIAHAPGIIPIPRQFIL